MENTLHMMKIAIMVLGAVIAIGGICLIKDMVKDLLGFGKEDF